MFFLKNFRNRDLIPRLILLLPFTWLTFTDGVFAVYLGVMDIPEKCNFTSLLCNDSRLLREDKVIILNIANDLRNKVAGGTFKYMNMQHDPVSNMNKLRWNETLAEEAAKIASSCPGKSRSYISEETEVVEKEDGLQEIKIIGSADPTDRKDDKMAGCDVSTITYNEELTKCAPQKIKERIIGYLASGGLGPEDREYDIRDFWIINRFGEQRLTFRRPEASNIGCSFIVRTSKTHYYAYLTCIHCSYNATLPVLGHAGEACPLEYPNLDKQYPNLCNDRSQDQYGDIAVDEPTVDCKTELDIEDSRGISGLADSSQLGYNVSTCKTTLVERNTTRRTSPLSTSSTMKSAPLDIFTKLTKRPSPADIKISTEVTTLEMSSTTVTTPITTSFSQADTTPTTLTEQSPAIMTETSLPTTSQTETELTTQPTTSVAPTEATTTLATTTPSKTEIITRPTTSLAPTLTTIIDKETTSCKTTIVIRDKIKAPAHTTTFRPSETTSFTETISAESLPLETSELPIVSTTEMKDQSTEPEKDEITSPVTITTTELKFDVTTSEGPSETTTEMAVEITETTTSVPDTTTAFADTTTSVTETTTAVAETTTSAPAVLETTTVVPEIISTAEETTAPDTETIVTTTTLAPTFYEVSTTTEEETTTNLPITEEVMTTSTTPSTTTESAIEEMEEPAGISSTTTTEINDINDVEMITVDGTTVMLDSDSHIIESTTASPETHSDSTQSSTCKTTIPAKPRTRIVRPKPLSTSTLTTTLTTQKSTLFSLLSTITQPKTTSTDSEFLTTTEETAEATVSEIVITGTDDSSSSMKKYDQITSVSTTDESSLDELTSSVSVTPSTKIITTVPLTSPKPKKTSTFVSSISRFTKILTKFTPKSRPKPIKIISTSSSRPMEEITDVPYPTLPKNMSDLDDTSSPENKNRTTIIPYWPKFPACICVNWFIISLIFSVAFIFSWCLLCWQKMLL